MIKLENAKTYGWLEAIYGMRNPLNSWDKIDSVMVTSKPVFKDILPGVRVAEQTPLMTPEIKIGPNDLALMKKLVDSGSDHRKFMRMITVYIDITAPLYWWKEYDTYKVGTVANSCSTMHKLTAKEFTIDDFSHDHLIDTCLLEQIINELNVYRNIYVNYDKQSDSYKQEFTRKDIWWQMIQLLPSSYNQTRTVMVNLEVLRNMYHSRKLHKLDEWREFCNYISNLPYSELITGEQK